MVKDRTEKTLVLGLGNLMLSDFGAGIEVIHRLRRTQPRPDCVDLFRAGIVNVALAGVIGHYHALIVVTCCDFSAAPGTVRELREEAMDTFLDSQESLDESLRDIAILLREGDTRPALRLLLLIQPDTRRVGRGLSSAVERCIIDLPARIIARASAWMSPAGDGGHHDRPLQLQ